MPDLRTRHHPDCVVCSPGCAHGLRLSLVLDAKGVAEGSFACDCRYEGYPGLLHGGVISAVLDGAMTNCLFLHGCAAVTAELVVRFRHPVALNEPARVRAWIAEDGPPVFRLQAELVQGGVTKATARAAFMLPQSARVKGQPS
jgi:acyl-coenzyme A thioesterase PaaI-like protein